VSITMPSHPKCPSVDNKSKERHSGGPLKRTGPKAEDWDAVVGPSLGGIPSTQLPTVSTVLQRYRALRIDRPRDTSSALAKEIAVEVKVIWDRARIPTFSEHNCYRKVLDTIALWKSRHNPGELDTAFRDKLQSLMDLKPRLRGKVTDEAQLENLKSLMRQTSDTKRRMSEGKQYDWEVDYQFYLDQYKVLIIYK